MYDEGDFGSFPGYESYVNMRISTEIRRLKFIKWNQTAL